MLRKNPVLCPVRLVEKYLARRLGMGKKAPLLCSLVGTCGWLSVNAVSSIVQRMAVRVGEVGNFLERFLRIGGAVATAQGEISLPVIQAVGR